MLVLTTDGIRELSEGELDNVAGGDGLVSDVVKIATILGDDIASGVTTLVSDVGGGVGSLISWL